MQDFCIVFPRFTCLEKMAKSSLKLSDEHTSPPGALGSRGEQVANSHFSKINVKSGNSGCLEISRKNCITVFNSSFTVEVPTGRLDPFRSCIHRALSPVGEAPAYVRRLRLPPVHFRKPRSAGDRSPWRRPRVGTHRHHRVSRGRLHIEPRRCRQTATSRKTKTPCCA